MLYYFLWFLFWHADMLNLHSDLFSKQSKWQKIQSIKNIEIILPLTKNNPNCQITRHTPSDSSITHLYQLSPFHLFPPYIHYLHWLNFWRNGCGRLPVNKHTVAIAIEPHEFKWDELVIATIPDDLTHTLLFTIHHPTILAYFSQFSLFSSFHITPISRPYSI